MYVKPNMKPPLQHTSGVSVVNQGETWADPLPSFQLQPVEVFQSLWVQYDAFETTMEMIAAFILVVPSQTSFSPQPGPTCCPTAELALSNILGIFC